MVCENCKQRHANVTVTQVQNGQKQERHYCEVCASQFHPFHFDLQDEPISLQQFISSWFGQPPQQESAGKKQSAISVTCPKCHFTYRQFLKEGKFGCATCYDTFREHLPPLFEKLHAGTAHIDTNAGPALQHTQLYKEIEKLRELLQEAIQQERFEDAASYRDQIKSMQETLHLGGDQHGS